ncbi:SusC/RagA family TonB-linked outer membrane protein [bacterium]|nr:SusC/RagA family TonB-linked outer membrane protein [bacterium]
MKHRLWILWMILLALGMTAWAQEAVQVKGLVTDEDGKPMAAANVVIPELGTGSATKADGTYSFTVPAARITMAEVTLQVSFIGYETQSVTIDLSGRNEIVQNFDMAVDVLKMGEIVVTGFGPGIEKEKLGVTIAKVRGDAIVGSDEGNVVSALHGKIANVEVTSSSGEPGSSSYIRIRGANSITGGTQPLFVVDGSPVSNEQYFSDNTLGHDGVSEMNRASDLNPEDIESIEILKGPAASAIYGSRAANGVILVSTKKGRPGDVKMSYKMSYSFDQVNKTVPLQQRWGQGVDGVYIEGMPWTWGPKLDSSVPVYDHGTEMFETGHVFENNLAVSGGSEKTTFYLSLGRYTQDGFIIGNSDYSKYSIRLNASQFINEKLRLSGNFNYNNVIADRIQRGSNVSGLLIGAWRTPPDFNNKVYLSPEGYHRSYRLPNPDTEEGSRGYNNPYFVVYEDLNLSEVNRAFGNLQIDYDPIRWVHLNYTLGQDYSNDTRRTLFPKGDSSYPDGRIAREMFNYSETDGHFTAEGTRFLDPASMRVNLLLGHQWNQRKFTQFSVFGEGIGATGFNQLDNVNTSLPDEYEYTIRDESFFGVVSVDLFKQLYLSGSLRNDGSSTFGRSKKRHWYPKGSVAWDFTALKPMQGIQNILSFGKLRLAYGEAGQQPDEYLWKTAYSTYIYTESYIQPNGGITPFAWGNSGFHSSYIKGNEDILPQRTKEVETGVDLAFLNNRIGLGVTYYDSRTEDVIYQFPVAPSTGYTNMLKNGGLITNKGIEVNLNMQPINTNNVKWDVDVVWATNKNKVVRLDGAEYIFLQGFETSCYAQEGYAMSVFRGTDFVRFGRDLVVTDAEGNRVNIDDTYSGWKAGDLYIAEDGFPIEESEDRVIGDPNPDWTGGIRNTITLWDKLSVSALFDMKIGGDVYDGTRGALYYFGTHEDTDIEEADLDGVVRRGKKYTFSGNGPGAGTEVFLDQDTWYAFGIGNSFGGPDQQFVEDGSYVKLREIAVSYKIRHPKLTAYTGLSDIDIRLSGRNLYTWTDYRGIDPETNISLNENWRGLDYFNHPQTRSFILTLRLNY